MAVAGRTSNSRKRMDLRFSPARRGPSAFASGMSGALLRGLVGEVSGDQVLANLDQHLDQRALGLLGDIAEGLGAGLRAHGPQPIEARLGIAGQVKPIDPSVAR